LLARDHEVVLAGGGWTSVALICGFDAVSQRIEVATVPSESPYSAKERYVNIVTTSPIGSIHHKAELASDRGFDAEPVKIMTLEGFAQARLTHLRLGMERKSPRTVTCTCSSGS
jgi:hypothetical protein